MAVANVMSASTSQPPLIIPLSSKQDVIPKSVKSSLQPITSSPKPSSRISNPATPTPLNHKSDPRPHPHPSSTTKSKSNSTLSSPTTPTNPPSQPQPQPKPKAKKKPNPDLSTKQLSNLSSKLFNTNFKPPRYPSFPTPPQLRGSCLPPPAAEIDERPPRRLRRFKLWDVAVPGLRLVILDSRRRAHLKRYQPHIIPNDPSKPNDPYLKGIRSQTYFHHQIANFTPSLLVRNWHKKNNSDDPNVNPSKAGRRAVRDRQKQHCFVLEQEHEYRFRIGMKENMEGVLKFERTHMGKTDFKPTADPADISHLTKFFRDIRKSSDAIFQYDRPVGLAPVKGLSEAKQAVRDMTRGIERRKRERKETRAREKEAKARPAAVTTYQNTNAPIVSSVVEGPKKAVPKTEVQERVQDRSDLQTVLDGANAFLANVDEQKSLKGKTLVNQSDQADQDKTKAGSKLANIDKRIAQAKEALAQLRSHATLTTVDQTLVDRTEGNIPNLKLAQIEQIRGRVAELDSQIIETNTELDQRRAQHRDGAKSSSSLSKSTTKAGRTPTTADNMPPTAAISKSSQGKDASLTVLTNEEIPLKPGQPLSSKRHRQREPERLAESNNAIREIDAMIAAAEASLRNLKGMANLTLTDPAFVEQNESIITTLKAAQAEGFKGKIANPDQRFAEINTELDAAESSKPATIDVRPELPKRVSVTQKDVGKVRRKDDIKAGLARSNLTLTPKNHRSPSPTDILSRRSPSPGKQMLNTSKPASPSSSESDEELLTPTSSTSASTETITSPPQTNMSENVMIQIMSMLSNLGINVNHSDLRQATWHSSASDAGVVDLDKIVSLQLDDEVNFSSVASDKSISFSELEVEPREGSLFMDDDTALPEVKMGEGSLLLDDDALPTVGTDDAMTAVGEDRAGFKWDGSEIGSGLGYQSFESELSGSVLGDDEIAHHRGEGTIAGS